MPAHKKRKIPKRRLALRKVNSAGFIPKLNQSVITFRDVNDFASFAKKNVTRFLNQLKKSILTKRGAQWPKK